MPNAKEVRILTEAAALRELKKGSEAALCWFIDAYTPYVTAIIHGIIGEHMDMADVEEVASDVFYALWENARKVYSVKGILAPWPGTRRKTSSARWIMTFPWRSRSWWRTVTRKKE